MADSHVLDYALTRAFEQAVSNSSEKVYEAIVEAMYTPMQATKVQIVRHRLWTLASMLHRVPGEDKAFLSRALEMFKDCQEGTGLEEDELIERCDTELRIQVCFVCIVVCGVCLLGLGL